MQSGKNIRIRITAFLLSLVMLMGCIAQLPASAQQTQAAGVNQTGLSSVATGTDTSDKILNTDDRFQIGTEHEAKIEHVARLRDEETLDTHVYLNKDGSRTLYFFDYPVQYLDSQGNRQDISMEIADTTDAKYPFRTKANSTITSFPASLSDGVKLTGNGVDLRLTSQLPFSNSSKQSVRRIDTETVSYTYDANTTIEYSLTYTGFKEDIVVNSYTGQTEYSFTLYTNGLAVTKIAGGYYLTDDAGEIQAAIGEIIVITADERNNTLGKMRVETIEPKQQYSLTIVLDPEYLEDPRTTYPIRIDPTITLNYESEASAIADVTLHSTNSSGGERTYLFLGMRSSGGISRILMKFPGIDFSEYAGVTITSATVSLRDLMCEGTQMPVTCHPFTGSDWEESNASWDTVTQSWGEALDSHVISYSNGTVFGHRYEFDIKEAVQKWVDGDLTITPEKGIIFKADDAIENSTNLENRTFGSFERDSYKPVFTMTYQLEVSLSQTNATIYKGESIALTATTVPVGEEVVWESENPEIASVNEDGVVTALSEGTSTITATLSDGTAARCEVEVIPKTISLNYNTSGNPATVYKGGIITIQATTQPAAEEVEWTSLDPNIAEVSEDGEVTGLNVGVATIKAELSDGTYVECRVYVLSKSITLSHTNITLYTDETQQLTATTVPPGEDVEWISLNSRIATVSSNGVVTAVRAGETTIQAVIDDETYAICTVTVEARQVILSETHLIMAPDEDFYLTATTVPANQQVHWFTGDESVAIVIGDGRVIAIGTGSTYITASLSDGTTEGCYVEVVERELYIEMRHDNVDVDSELTITARTVPENRLVVWESSDPTIATVNEQGVVTGIKAGVVTIRAFMPAGPSISSTIYVTVEDGVYYISNEFSNYYLQTDGRKITGFTNVVQAAKLAVTADVTSRIAQMWRITYLDEGLYTIRPISKVDMCLYADWCTSAWAEPVVIYPHADDDYENVPPRAQWSITMTDKGYAIKYCGVDDYALKAKDGSGMANAPIVVGPYESTMYSCHWELSSVTNVPVGLVLYDGKTGLPADYTQVRFVAPEESRYLDQMGLEVVVYPHLFYAEDVRYDVQDEDIAEINNLGKVTGIANGGTMIHVQLLFTCQIDFPLWVTLLPEGTYYLRNKTTGCYADIDGQVMENNRTIHQWEFHGGNTQKWTFTHLGDGTYSIHSENSSTKYYLGVKDDSSSINQDIVLRTGSLTSGMKWTVTLRTNGAFILTPKTGEANDFVLATSTLLATNGAKLIQGDYIDNNSYCDEWEIRKTKYVYNIIHYYDQGYDVRFGNGQEDIAAYQAACSAILLKIFDIEVISTVYAYTSCADTCTGTPTTLGDTTTVCSGHLLVDHKTRNKIRSDLISQFGRGSNVLSRVAWTGHALDSNASSSVSASHTIVMAIGNVTNFNFNNLAADRIREIYIYELLHETSHQLGAPDHYCYDMNSENCDNPSNDCWRCDKGLEEEPVCVMTEMPEDFGDLLENGTIGNLYCSQCMSSTHEKGIVTYLKKYLT